MLGGVERLPDGIDPFEPRLAQGHHERLAHGGHLAVPLRSGGVAPVEYRQQRLDQAADARRDLLAPLRFDSLPVVLELRPLALQLVEIVIPLGCHGFEL